MPKKPLAEFIFPFFFPVTFYSQSGEYLQHWALSPVCCHFYTIGETTQHKKRENVQVDVSQKDILIVFWRLIKMQVSRWILWMSSLKFLLSILTNSNRKRFCSAFIFLGFHNQSAVFMAKEAGGERGVQSWWKREATANLLRETTVACSSWSTSSKLKFETIKRLACLLLWRQFYIKRIR